MTVEQHLAQLIGNHAWDLSVKLAKALADIDDLHQLVESLQKQLANQSKD